jgi:hypothetical protein
MRKSRAFHHINIASGVHSAEEKYSDQMRLTKRAPDVWDSARFQAVFVAWSWFRQNGATLSRPAAGNANR